MRLGLTLQRPSRATLSRLLEALCRHDVDYLTAHPTTPALYRAGVEFRREERGREEWLDVPGVLSARVGDCEDLACWRAAELRVRGIAARPVLRYGGRPGLLHAVVALPDGRFDDPARRLKR